MSIRKVKIRKYFGGRFWPVMLLAALITAGPIRNADAYSYNAYTAMTGKHTFAVVPYVWGGYSPFGLTVDPAIAYGFTDNFDVYASPGPVTLVDKFNYSGDGFWILPRYDIGGYNIVALMLTADSFSPQYHTEFRFNDDFFVEFNLWPFFSYNDLANPAITAIIAPVYLLSEGFGLYFEIDPTYDVASSETSVAFAPGIVFDMGAGGWISFSVPVEYSNGEVGDPGFAFWYWKQFDL